MNAKVTLLCALSIYYVNVGRGSIMLLLVGRVGLIGVESSQLNVIVTRGHDDPVSDINKGRNEELKGCFLSSILRAVQV